MPVFTTYHIPEAPGHQTSKDKAWLHFVVSSALNDVSSDMLQKISAALQADYEFESTVHVCQKDETVTWSDHFGVGVKLVISFGVFPSTLGLWLDLSGPGICHLESFSFILTNTLEELQKDPQAKRLLWKQMQTFLETK